ncbi:PhoH family protein, partial [Pontibaca methylaminivorans]|uniref:PhoH family protein n=1 Tax=Pontibaca methylaminivorans TaxID=515897 RepID=UPI002FDB8FC6
MATGPLTPLQPDDAQREVEIEFPDNRLLIELCGEYDRNLALIERELDVQIMHKGNILTIIGEPASRARAGEVLRLLYARLESGRSIENGDIDRELRLGGASPAPGRPGTGGPATEIRTRKRVVEPRTEAQRSYLRTLLDNDLVFGIGPAGTGKTYLAVAVGVSMFIAGRVDRIILSRPAVEAGEKLGYLPGDMKEKVDPYMQPLYD